MRTYKEALSASNRAAEHEAVRRVNYFWDLEWNGRAAERRAINSPWPAKQEVNHA
jgi:hypothetical protein